MELVAEGIFLIDTEYMHRGMAASYMIVDGDTSLFVETNTSLNVHRLVEAHRQKTLIPDKLDYAVITHVHLDHASGSGYLLKNFPGAKLICHPRGAKHMVDPQILIKSSVEVYGKSVFDELYGEILPVEPDRVKTVEDNEVMEFGSRTLTFFHTRGHANHHICILDSKTDGIFTGDSFGIGYRDLNIKGQFVIWSATPTQFDPDESRKTIDRIASCGAKQAYLTHFGVLDDLSAAAGDLHEDIDVYEDLVDRGVRGDLEGEALYDFFFRRMRDHVLDRYERINKIPMPENHWNYISIDVDLNSKGLVYLSMKRRSMQ